MPRNDDFAINPQAIECNQWRYTPESTRLSRFRLDYGNRVLQVQWRNGHPDPRKVKWPHYEQLPGRPIRSAKAKARKGYIYGHEEGDDAYEVYRGLINSASRGHYINIIDKRLDYRPMSDPEWRDAKSTKKGKGPKSRYYEDEED